MLAALLSRRRDRFALEPVGLLVLTAQLDKVSSPGWVV